MINNILQAFLLLLFLAGLACNLIGLFLWVKKGTTKSVWMISLGIITIIGMYLVCCLIFNLSVKTCIFLFAVILGLLLFSVVVIAISIATWIETKKPYRLFTIISIGGLLASIEISQMLIKLY